MTGHQFLVLHIMQGTLHGTDDPVAGSGASATSAADLFTYVTAADVPAVTGVSPALGAAAGGDTVTVTGSGLVGVTSVLFGRWT